MRALDLFCGGGGAARGLIAAGFDVVGIDIKNHRKSYPGLFIQGDALRPPVRLEDFDFVWASPPCQAFSQGLDCQPERRALHPNRIPETRSLLEASGVPYCIENVPRAPIRADVVLTGAQFGLELVRRRHFETAGFARPFALMQVHAGKTVTNGDLACVAGNGIPTGSWTEKWSERPAAIRDRLRERNSLAGWRAAMGLPPGVMAKAEIKEAIPPAYAEFIGRAAMEHLQ